MNIKRWIGNVISLNVKNNGGISMSNSRIQELQKRLSANMNKAIILAEKNCVRNEKGHIVLAKDDEWRDEDEWEI